MESERLVDGPVGLALFSASVPAEQFLWVVCYNFSDGFWVVLGASVVAIVIGEAEFGQFSGF